MIALGGGETDGFVPGKSKAWVAAPCLYGRVTRGEEKKSEEELSVRTGAGVVCITAEGGGNNR